jgi:hypothetical protein
LAAVPAANARTSAVTSQLIATPPVVPVAAVAVAAAATAGCSSDVATVSIHGSVTR